jgi:hypothetical protein
VKRALAWFAGLASIAALGRILTRRRQRPQLVTKPTAATSVGDPAEELRRKLADQREPDVEPAGPTETLEERRARVHAKAREAIDAMGDAGDGT